MTTTTELDLRRFCEYTSFRYDLKKPFVVNGWLYATDGRVCVRVPSKAKDSTGKFPAAWRLFKDFRKSRSCFVAPPGVVSDKACTECHGCGREPMENCRQCDGEGEVPTEHGMLTCHLCAAAGPTCRYCDGTKLIPADQEWGNRIFRGCELSRILWLPGLRVLLADDPTHEQPMPFVADGGLQGLLMPVMWSKREPCN